ncbi:RNA polymerase sigma factor CnrH [Novipirellula aureliae]|uniref:RNA polymerase sigma factor CnrH n=1 Tax=Novipirellula aureliae TaxID=2527966 RepID=A0A5C6DX02_9BACT|nr:sigma-70 family RNA polymerase sigma factor [Novipirellula aureliae]TWU39911.1 RNA polymerase sigma factor CnrH [Novipirellula aureliae]
MLIQQGSINHRASPIDDSGYHSVFISPSANPIQTMQTFPGDAKQSTPSSFATSASLLHRVQANDQTAWSRLVDLYGVMVYRWAVRGGLSHDDAADVMQDVFMAVAGAIRRFDLAAKGKFRAWLWTITRNKINDHFRRNVAREIARGGSTELNRMSQIPESWTDNLPDNWDENASPINRSEVDSLYRRAMQLIEGDFQPQTWRAFYLSVVEQKSTDEVARELNLSPNSVRQAKSRVLRRLRAELDVDR